MVVQVGRGDGDEVRIRQWLEEKSKIRGKRVIKMEALYEKRMRAQEKAAKLAGKNRQTAEDLANLTLFMDASHINLEQDDNGMVVLQFHGVRTFDPDSVHLNSGALWFNKRQPFLKVSHYRT